VALTFLTVDQLRTHLANPDLDSGQAQLAIDRAAGLIKSVAGLSLEFVQGQTQTLVGGTDRIVLPQRPLVRGPSDPLTVYEVDMSGATHLVVEGQYFYVQGDVLSRRWPGAPWPGQYFPAARWPSLWWWPGQQRGSEVWGPRVQVTWSSGYQSSAALPPGLLDIMLGLAAGFVVNPGLIREEQVGGVRVQYMGNQRGTGTASLINQLRQDLRAIGLRRGGVFSVGG
jgi:hypothetical protein